MKSGALHHRVGAILGFSRNRTKRKYTERGIYYKELVHMTMEADTSQGLHVEWASWSPRQANGGVLVQAGRLDTQKNP